MGEMLEAGGGSWSWGASRERLLVARLVSSPRDQILRNQSARSISLLSVLPKSLGEEQRVKLLPHPTYFSFICIRELLVLVKYMFHKWLHRFWKTYIRCFSTWKRSALEFSIFPVRGGGSTHSILLSTFSCAYHQSCEIAYFKVTDAKLPTHILSCFTSCSHSSKIGNKFYHQPSMGPI